MANIIKHRSTNKILFADAISGMSLFKDEDGNQGWSAYSAKFGVVPNHHLGPVIFSSKMFNRTLKNKKAADAPIVYEHDMNQIIAVNKKHGTDIDGLRYKAGVIKNHDISAEKYNLITQGVLTQNSVGLVPIKIVEGTAMLNGKEEKLPMITEARLHHHSVVAVAAQPSARIEEVFSEKDIYALQGNDPLNSTHNLDSHLALDPQPSAHSLSLILNAGANKITRLINEARFKNRKMEKGG